MLVKDIISRGYAPKCCLNPSDKYKKFDKN